MPSTYEKIATNTLSSATNTFTFSSISGAYTDLILQVNNQMTGASGWKLRFNGDSGNNYSLTNLVGYGTAPTSFRVADAASVYNNFVFGDSTTSGYFTPNIIQLQNYSNSTTYKSLIWRYGTGVTNSNSGEVGEIVGMWRSTAAITSIEISAWNAVNFAAGTSMNLYGIKAA